jgi:hypothetical protein
MSVGVWQVAAILLGRVWRCAGAPVHPRTRLRRPRNPSASRLTSGGWSFAGPIGWSEIRCISVPASRYVARPSYRNQPRYSDMLSCSCSSCISLWSCMRNRHCGELLRLSTASIADAPVAGGPNGEHSPVLCDHTRGAAAVGGCDLSRGFQWSLVVVLK